MQIGYIFDLDGVITDTAQYHYRSWKQLADEVGILFTRTDNDAMGVASVWRAHVLRTGLVGARVADFIPPLSS